MEAEYVHPHTGYYCGRGLAWGMGKEGRLGGLGGSQGGDLGDSGTNFGECWGGVGGLGGDGGLGNLDLCERFERSKNGNRAQGTSGGLKQIQNSIGVNINIDKTSQKSIQKTPNSPYSQIPPKSPIKPTPKNHFPTKTHNKQQQPLTQQITIPNYIRQSAKKPSIAKFTRKTEKSQTNTNKDSENNRQEKYLGNINNGDGNGHGNAHGNAHRKKNRVRVNLVPQEKVKEETGMATGMGRMTKDTYKRKTCKMFDLDFRVEDEDSRSTMGNLIVNIQANRYQQIGEECVYPDGRKEKMYKVFKSSKSAKNFQREKDDEMRVHSPKDNQQCLEKIDEKNNESQIGTIEAKPESELSQKIQKGRRKYKSSRFSELLNKQNLQKLQKFMQQKQAEQNNDKSQSSHQSQQQIQIISKAKTKKQKRRNYSMRRDSRRKEKESERRESVAVMGGPGVEKRCSINSRFSRGSRMTKESKKFIMIDVLLNQMEVNKNVNISFESMKNRPGSTAQLNERNRSTLHPNPNPKRKSSRNSLSNFNPNPSPNPNPNPSLLPFQKTTKNYKWQNWQIHNKNQPKQQLMLFQINKKIIQKQQRQQHEYTKKIEKQYQELHKLITITNQIEKIKKNQSLILKMREENLRRIQGVFLGYEREILLT